MVLCSYVQNSKIRSLEFNMIILFQEILRLVTEKEDIFLVVPSIRDTEY